MDWICSIICPLDCKKKAIPLETLSKQISTTLRITNQHYHNVKKWIHRQAELYLHRTVPWTGDQMQTAQRKIQLIFIFHIQETRFNAAFSLLYYLVDIKDTDSPLVLSAMRRTPDDCASWFLSACLKTCHLTSAGTSSSLVSTVHLLMNDSQSMCAW